MVALFVRFVRVVVFSLFRMGNNKIGFAVAFKLLCVQLSSRKYQINLERVKVTALEIALNAKNSRYRFKKAILGPSFLC